MNTRTMLRTTATLTAFAAALALTGCASPGYGVGAPAAASYPSAPQPAYASGYGVVDAIEMTNAPQAGIGPGTVIGGIVGGILGNQVGGGTGNTVATVAGAVGGAVAGNQIEKRTNQQPVYNVRLRMNDRSYQTVTQTSIGDLRVGDRVRLENGRIYRY